MKHSELIDIFDWFQRVAWRSESDEKNWCGTSLDLLAQLLDVAQSDRTGRPFDLMPLFDNPFLVAGGQIRLQNGHVARHHLLKHRETIVDKLRSHQDVLSKPLSVPALTAMIKKFWDAPDEEAQEAPAADLHKADAVLDTYPAPRRLYADRPPALPALPHPVHPRIS